MPAASRPAALAVRLFGALSADVGGRTIGVRDFGGKKPRQLFEILLVARGRAVGKGRIAEYLWPERAPRNAHATLESYVSVLRRIVGADVVVTEQGAYRIAAERVELDLDRFDAHCSRATAALRDRAPEARRDAREQLDAAVELLRGEVLEHEPHGAWAETAREAYRQKAVVVLADAAEAALADGDARAALARAEAAIARDTTCERAHRAGMRARQLLGRRDEAVAAFERCRSALAHALGVEPATETKALVAELRRGEAAPVVPVVPGPPRPTGREVPLLGRVAEIARLEHAARASLDANEAALLVIEGEAGIGKSRVLAELAARLPACRIGRAKCFPLDVSVAFAPLAEAVRGLGVALDPERHPALGEIVPELGLPGLAPETSRARALESLVQLVREHAPVALVLDDVQWSDASSLAAIAYLLRRARGFALIVACATRTEDTQPDHPLRALEAREHVVLSPLTSGDLAPLGVDGLHDKTGGNALFVVEYLRGLAEGGEIPRTLRDVILGRARAAGEAEHRALAVASVLGRTFDATVLARTLGADVGATIEAVERLVERKLLAPVGERFDFRHDLIRQTLYASMSPARRRHLHARALDVLEAGGADPADLAWHAEQAGALGRAVHWSIRAGDLTRSRWANVEAALHYERARRLSAQLPETREPGAHDALLTKLARVLFTLGRGDEARDAADEARRSAEARGDDAALFDALETSCVVLHRGLGRPSAALEQGRTALSVAERLGSPVLVARAHALVGSPAGSVGRLDDAIEHCGAAVAIAEAAGLAPRAFPMGRMALTLHFRAREAESLAWGERAEAAARAQGDEETVLMARWVRALSLTALGRFSAAWRALDSIAEVGRGEEAFWHARVPNTYGAILAEVGQHARALEHDLESLAAARSSSAQTYGEAEMQTLLNVAQNRLALGRVYEARADVEAVRRRIAAIEYSRFRWLARMHAVDAEIAIAEDDADRARSAAEACLALAVRYGMPRYDVRGRVALARALFASGRQVAARREAIAAAQTAADRGLLPLAARAFRVAHELGVASARERSESASRAIGEQLEEPLRTMFQRAISRSIA